MLRPRSTEKGKNKAAAEKNRPANICHSDIYWEALIEKQKINDALHAIPQEERMLLFVGAQEKKDSEDSHQRTMVGSTYQSVE